MSEGIDPLAQGQYDAEKAKAAREYRRQRRELALALLKLERERRAETMGDGIAPLTQAQFDAQKAKVAKENYIERDLVAVDQAANVATGGLPDETISSRLARAATAGKWWGKLGSKILDKFQPDHGAKAMAGDTERGEAVVAEEERYDGGLE